MDDINTCRAEVFKSIMKESEFMMIMHDTKGFHTARLTFDVLQDNGLADMLEKGKLKKLLPLRNLNCRNIHEIEKIAKKDKEHWYQYWTVDKKIVNKNILDQVLYDIQYVCGDNLEDIKTSIVEVSCDISKTFFANKINDLIDRFRKFFNYSLFEFSDEGMDSTTFLTDFEDYWNASRLNIFKNHEKKFEYDISEFQKGDKDTLLKALKEILKKNVSETCTKIENSINNMKRKNVSKQSFKIQEIHW